MKNDEIEDRTEKAEKNIAVCTSFFAELECESLQEETPLVSKDQIESNL